MRASILGFCSLALLFAGCQSVSTPTGRIVGDSMSLGRPPFHAMGHGHAPMAPMGGFSQGCTDPSCQSGPFAAPGYFPGPEGMGDCPPEMVGQGGMGMAGCAGPSCDGRCGGRCQLAMARLMALKAQYHANFDANHPHIANKLRHLEQKCAGGHCGGAAGPEYGAVHYPYYTTRGPRDFLLANPPSIGP